LGTGKTHQEDFRLAWLRLARTHRVGARTFAELMKFIGDPLKALEMLPGMVKNGGLKSTIQVPSLASIQWEIERTKKFGGKFIYSCDKEYPNILKQIPDAPPVIVVKGRVELLQQKGIAIIGARNSSINANRLASYFSREISKQYVIISGMARGVDSFAHKAGLENGTIGVIAGGINNIYPKENQELFENLHEHGLIIAEQAIDSEIHSKHFPQRNRIIAGLALGILVVEASIRSGTLITCKYALDYNREIMAIPGSPLDQNAQGTNKLIKEGATLVSSPQDILNLMNLADNSQYNIREESTNYISSKQRLMPLEDDLRIFRDKLLSVLSYAEISLNDLTEQLGIPINVMNFLLLELELAGNLVRIPGDKVQLIKSEDEFITV
jgi:DNA processing protein